MRLVDDPQVDCWTLRNLKNTILEQRVSVKAVVLQPQVYRRLKIPAREYLAAVLPGLANLSIQRLPELTPTAWAASNL